jgi:hypothetical protein
MDVAGSVEELINKHLTAELQKELGLLLTAMGYSAGLFLLAQKFAPFADLPLSERQEV